MNHCWVLNLFSMGFLHGLTVVVCLGYRRFLPPISTPTRLFHEFPSQAGIQK
jgi:hypothetical protein